MQRGAVDKREEMKTPTNIGGNNLVTFLQNATEFRMADLYTITLKAGEVLRYTTWDMTLKVFGNTFLTGPPNIEHTAIEEQLGMDVSTIEITITASPSDLLNGVPILQSIGMGMFDGAAFKIERLFIDNNNQQIGTVIRFAGFIGPIDELARTYCKLTVNSGTELLQIQLPQIILQTGCTNTLFDARCGLSKAAFAESETMQAGSTVNKVVSLSGQADGYFDNGQIAFTSGANSGLVKAVKQYFGPPLSQFTFNSPLPFVPNAGDTFTAYPGCDKTQATCTNKFSNLVNFEGFPYVPVPETAI